MAVGVIFLKRIVLHGKQIRRPLFLGHSLGDIGDRELDGTEAVVLPFTREEDILWLA